MLGAAWVNRVAWAVVGAWCLLFVILNFAPLLGRLFEVFFLMTLFGVPVVLSAFAYSMIAAARFDPGALTYWQIAVTGGVTLAITGGLLAFFIGGMELATPSSIAAYVLMFVLSALCVASAPSAWRARRAMGRRLIRAAYLKRQQEL